MFTYRLFLYGPLLKFPKPVNPNCLFKSLLLLFSLYSNIQQEILLLRSQLAAFTNKCMFVKKEMCSGRILVAVNGPSRGCVFLKRKDKGLPKNPPVKTTGNKIPFIN